LPKGKIRDRWEIAKKGRVCNNLGIGKVENSLEENKGRNEKSRGGGGFRKGHFLKLWRFRVQRKGVASVSERYSCGLQLGGKYVRKVRKRRAQKIREDHQNEKKVSGL